MNAHLVKGMDQGDRELWVTDLTKVAYVRAAKPQQENPIQQAAGPLGTTDRE